MYLRFVSFVFAWALVHQLLLVSGSDVVVLDKSNFEHDTQAATGATTGDWFVEFYAPWCGHCKKLAPIWESVATELKGEVNVAKLDVSANRSIMKRFGIKGFPTLLFFKQGFMYKYQGRRDFEKLVEFAKGGYEKSEKLPVPSPNAGGIADIVSTVEKEIEDMISGRNSKQLLTLVIGIAVGMVISGIGFFLINTLFAPPPQTGPRAPPKGEYYDQDDEDEDDADINVTDGKATDKLRGVKGD